MDKDDNSESNVIKIKNVWEFHLGYKTGQEVMRTAVKKEIDYLMRKLERHEKGSATIEADTEGFNRGIAMLGLKLCNRLSELPE